MEKVPMTADGYSALIDEVKILKTVERPRIIRAIEEARAHGDLSENAEYHAAKEAQGWNEARVAELEDKTEALAMNHDTFSRNTRNQLKQVFDALRKLMTPPDPPKRPIGFITPEDKKDTPKGTAKAKTAGKKT